MKHINVSVVVSHAPWRRAIPKLVSFSKAILAAVPYAPAVKGYTLAVAYLGDAAQQQLNKQFRAKDKPTNVLSFTGDAAHRQLGDITLAYETVSSEAAAAGLALEAHLAHLLVHGALHLQGYDHERDRDAAVMMQKEVEILAALGYKDPYAA